MRRAPALGLVVVLAVVLTGLAAPAAARRGPCGCEESVSRGVLALGIDTAVVGEITAVGAREPDVLGADPRRVTIAVELAVHRDVGSTLELVLDLEDGCGGTVDRGDYVGLLLHEGWQSGVSMCGVVAADALLTASGLPEPTATGSPALLATGDLGYAGSVLLDASGRVLGYGSWDEQPARPVRTDRGHDRAQPLAACPGGHLAVERAGDIAWSGQRPAPRIVLRDLATGAVRRATGLDVLLGDDPRSGPNVLVAAHCLDDAGTVLAVLGYYDAPPVGRRRIVRIDDGGATTVAEGAFHEVLPAGGRALTRIETGRTLGWLDLGTGALTRIGDLPADTRSVVLGSDGRTAFVSAGPDALDPDADPPRVLGVDLGSGRVTAEALVPDIDAAPRLLPLRDGGVLASGSSIPGEPAYHRFDAELQPAGAVTAEGWLWIVDLGDALVGTDFEGRLWRLRPGDGAFTPLADATDLRLAFLLALPAGAPPVAQAPAPGPVVHRPEPVAAPQRTVAPSSDPSPAPSPSDAVAPESSSPSDGDGPADVPGWPVTLVVAALVGLALLRSSTGRR